MLTTGHYLASVGISKNQRLMGNGEWQTWTVSKILPDEVYTSDMMQGKIKTIGHKQEWIVVCGTHELLVSRELFGTADGTETGG